jgi:inorganic triphosphatase YgiF
MDIARDIARQLPVRVGVLTKAERGYALAAGTLDKVYKSAPVEVRPEMSVAEAFAIISAACLKHFRLNEDLLVRERDALALHQARVAMRRLRSALSLFRPALLDEAFPRIREELRWFTSGLGEARNLDVFLKACGQDDVEAKEQLLTQRERAYDGVIETIGSRRFRLLMIEIVVWAETGDWRDGRKARAPIRSFASRRLDRLWQKVAERGAKLTELDDEERHRLRIDVKKLRYGAEFMGALYAPGASGQKQFVRQLEKLQEQLGHLNDMATARLMVTTLEPGVETEPSVDTSAEAAAALSRARDAMARLTKSGPYWS